MDRCLLLVVLALACDQVGMADHSMGMLGGACLEVARPGR